jgi:hypothetical protein
MEDPEPKNKFEFYFEAVLLITFGLGCIGMIVVGATICTAVHPCAVWSTILMVTGGALLSVPMNILVVLLLLPKMVEHYRRNK